MCQQDKIDITFLKAMIIWGLIVNPYISYYYFSGHPVIRTINAGQIKLEINLMGFFLNLLNCCTKVLTDPEKKSTIWRKDI